MKVIGAAFSSHAFEVSLGYQECSNAGQEAQLKNTLKYTFILLGF